MGLYRHLSREDREQIAVLRAAGHSNAGIAAALGRAPPTISREIKRNALDSAATRRRRRMAPTCCGVSGLPCWSGMNTTLNCGGYSKGNNEKRLCEKRSDEAISASLQ